MTKRSFALASVTTAIVASAALPLSACEMMSPATSAGTSVATPPPPPPPVCTAAVSIATVTAAGDSAFIIRAGSITPEPARVGDKLCLDDRFRTGAGTMHLRTSTGGEIQVYENTDPLLTLFKHAGCFGVSFFHSGKLVISAKEFCLNGELKQASIVGYEAKGEVLQVWVLQGQVRLLLPPFATINEGQRAVVRRGQVIRTDPFPRQEFFSVFPRAGRNQAPVIL